MSKIQKKSDTEIKMVDLALYLPEHSTIIFSDFHLGYEEMLTSKGTLVPRFQLKDTIERLDKIFQLIKKTNKKIPLLKEDKAQKAKNPITKPIKTIIINGDLKHEFGRISNQEWRDVLRLIDYFSRKTEEIIVIKGNHDITLAPITRKRNVTIKQHHIIDNLLIAHGDAIDDNAADKSVNTIIIGHEHPAIGLKDTNRVEYYKCFLVGKWKKKKLIVQPSFNLLTEGSDVLQRRFLSPYLEKGIDNFSIFVVGVNILPFGKVRDHKWIITP
jgi:uncharacterized protein